MQSKPDLDITVPTLDFWSWLEREFLKRRAKNPHYSLRAFANYLELAPATVSQLLAGKRRPSVRFASRLLQQLEATPLEREKILRSLEKKKLSLPAKANNEIDTRASTDEEIDEEEEFHLIALDAFRLLADWQHYAILELISTRDFRYDPAWIANQLDLSVTEVRQAIARLLRLDLVEEKRGTLKKTNVLITNYEEGQTSSAHKQLQRHILNKALAAIDEVPASEKDVTSMTMAIDEKKLAEAKKRIKAFRRQLCRYLENGVQTRVYNLGIQLYPISKGHK